MVKLGHVALDGTKIKADASKHAAMSYARLKKQEPQPAQVVATRMEEARSADEEEDEEHEPGRRGDELPDHIREKLKKLLVMREAMEKLEAEAKEEAARVAKRREEKEKVLGRGLTRAGGGRQSSSSSGGRPSSQKGL